MAKRYKIIGAGRRRPRTNWAMLVISATVAGLVAGVAIVVVPNLPWDTRGSSMTSMVTGARLR